MPLIPFETMQLAHYEKKIRTVQEQMYRRLAPLQEIRFYDGELAGAEHPDFDDRTWSPFAVGHTWGGRDKIGWFRIPFTVPAQAQGQKLALLVLPGKKFVFKSSEGGDLREYELLVYLDGRPLQSIDVRRTEIPLWDLVRPGEKHLLAIEAFSGLEAHDHLFAQVDLVAINSEVEQFYFTVKNIFDTAVAIGENHPVYPEWCRILHQALLEVDFLNLGQASFFASIVQANAKLEKVLYRLESEADVAPTVVSLGHSHLDLAWKWQIKHSIRKAARTCANALRLADLYPEYRFTQSQAQLYQWVQRYYPPLFSAIREKIKTGQWEATGGMWVESDCNIPSGESLMRQFVYGKRYFRQNLACDPQVVWLPDCFGFCYSLPQIMKQCGMRYFVTTKLSWNEYTRFPHDTFLWEGVDGTRILSHFITTPDRRGWNDYSVDLTAANIKACWDNYHQKKMNHNVMLSFGWGDGGGGPTREMLENGRRLQQMNGMPRHRQGQAESFFQELEARGVDWPVWNDELYLQLHRGTYTSQAKIKKQNRESEILLHHIELFSVLAFQDSADYPADEIDRLWETVLLNQFHDILPGSSIAEVYQDCDRDYERVQQKGAILLENALQKIGRDVSGPSANPGLLVFNPLPWIRSDIVCLPAVEGELDVRDQQGSRVPAQRAHDGSGVLMNIADLPSLGYTVFPFTRKETGAALTSSLSISPSRMENRFFRMELDGDGCLRSIYDKRHHREIIVPGQKGNLLQAFEDLPMANNAWDIDIFFQDKVVEVTALDHVNVVEQGPIRGGVELQRPFQSSMIRQRIYIYDSIPRIDFVSDIDWQEHQVLLKAAFPVNIHAARATYDIPFATIERPTHRNTDWDKARYEVPAQKWADLSEGDYGVSLLNDCKYGYDIKDNLMRLTLLKSAIDPDPNADIGHHRFSYALYPHAGDWRQGQTMRMAYQFNVPLLARRHERVASSAAGSRCSWVESNAENIVIETVKRAENGSGIILRAFEAFNQRGRIELQFQHTLISAALCNGLEEEMADLSFEKSRLALDFRPYEIKTIKIQFKK